MNATTLTAGEPRLRAMRAATMCEAFQQTVADYGHLPALRTPGDAFTCTWREYGDRVRRTAAGLAALGVGRGDTVGIMLTNRPEFHWHDAAAMHLGATAFSIYNTSAPDQIAYLLGDAGNRVLVTERAFLDRIDAARDRLDALEHVIVVDDDAPGLDETDDAGFDFEAAWRAVTPDDVATLIYTSGTTGPPKGVQLTHANLMYEVWAFDVIQPMDEPQERVASYLPMAHIAERIFSHYHAIPRAHLVTPVADPTAIVPALGDIRPTWFVGVPRVWEKMKAGLEAKLAGNEQAAQAIAAGIQRVRLEQAGQPVPEPLAAALTQAEEKLFAPVRAALGFGDLKLAFVGAAPTPPAVMEFFFAIGIPMCEVWGMSETTAVVTANPPERMKIGTVGTPLPGAEVRLDGDGEILVRGPMVMPGYRNMPDRTAETIDADGWLRTGDVGELDADGYLRIVDRKKELIINAAGKNMSPANIEAKLKTASPLIGQAVAIGDGRPYNVALIVLDPDAAAGRAHDDPEVRREVEAGIARANEQLSRVEQIKRFAILPGDWVPGGDELTPTMKLKRRPIAEKYAAEIESLYA